MVTIEAFGTSTTSAARDYAKELKRRVDRGEDPMGRRHKERAAPIVDELIDRLRATSRSRRAPKSPIPDCPVR